MPSAYTAFTSLVLRICVSENVPPHVMACPTIERTRKIFIIKYGEAVFPSCLRQKNPSELVCEPNGYMCAFLEADHAFTLSTTGCPNPRYQCHLRNPDDGSVSYATHWGETPAEVIRHIFVHHLKIDRPESNRRNAQEMLGLKFKTVQAVLACHFEDKAVSALARTWMHQIRTWFAALLARHPVARKMTKADYWPGKAHAFLRDNHDVDRWFRAAPPADAAPAKVLGTRRPSSDLVHSMQHLYVSVQDPVGASHSSGRNLLPSLTRTPSARNKRIQLVSEQGRLLLGAALDDVDDMEDLGEILRLTSTESDMLVFSRGNSADLALESFVFETDDWLGDS